MSDHRRIAGLLATLLITVAGCGHIASPAAVDSSPTTLTMAFGLTTGSAPQSGARQAAEIIGGERLVGFARDGRPQARLAESWTSSPDGLHLVARLRANATFHDGHPVSASAVRDALTTQLPGILGAAYADIDEIRTPSANEVEFVLKRRSAFVFEALSEVGIRAMELPGGLPNNAGPFKVVRMTEQGAAEMVAHDKYYGGRPLIDRIQIKPYASVRAAWADMLRGQVDMLYELGPDAIDVLQPTSSIRLVIQQRNYAYVVILNVQRPALRDREFRQALNAAIDRQALVADILKGHGTPAVSGVRPNHWAYDNKAPTFQYEPRAVNGRARSFTCLLVDPSLERLGLAVQKQLYAVGVDMQLEETPLDEGRKRIAAGDFDAILADAQMGPTLLQPYRFWRSGSPNDWGGFNNPQVDAAFDAIREANDDDAYRAGVSAFQRAIFNDPPAIFLAWSERARAVSTRFDVPVEPGRDILATLRLWRPLADQQLASRN